MIIQMDPGIGKSHPLTKAVVALAEELGVNTKVGETAGTGTKIAEVYLLDGKNRACALPEHSFRQMPGVCQVRRVTPAAVNLVANGSKPHHIDLGLYKVGNDLPCCLIAGPCTVDQYVDELVGRLVEQGITLIRGGCWKPRSNAWSFPGFGKKAVQWLLGAAKKYGVTAVFLEVLDETHLLDVQEIKRQVGYQGKVVLWVGARTDNQNLLRKLGRQQDFAVMIKNPLQAGSISEWANRVEFVIAGERNFDINGQLIPEESLRQGNDQILLCSRGVASSDQDSIFRFEPRHSWITAAREKFWAPVGVDPSHSAGTMKNDLVLRNLEAALIHRPAFALVECHFGDSRKPLCDADQAVPLARMSEIKEMIDRHNQAHY